MDVTEVIERALNLQLEWKWREALDLLEEAAREQPCEDLNLEIASHCTAWGWMFCEDTWLAEHEQTDAPITPEWVRSDATALELFQKSLARLELPAARAGLAGVQFRRGDLEKAESNARAALDGDPECPPALVLLGRLKMLRGNIEEAGEAFATAVQAAPRYAAAYLGLGEALRRAGRKEESDGAFRAGLAVSPANDAIMAAQARIATEEGDPDRARGFWRKAVEFNRFNADSWRGLALESARAGDPFETSRALEEAHALDEDGTRRWIEKSKKEFPLLDARE